MGRKRMGRKPGRMEAKLLLKNELGETDCKFNAGHELSSISVKMNGKKVRDNGSQTALRGTRESLDCL